MVRTIIFWCHLTAGLLAGSVILIMSATGVALAYEKQIITWVDGRAPEKLAPLPPGVQLSSKQMEQRRADFERRMTPAQKSFRKIQNVHRWLGAPRGSKYQSAARGITGAANLAFLFLVMSGFYLWWPRNWSRTAVRAVTVIKPGLQGKPRNFNWHNSIGFWCAPFLFFIVLTGACISYKLSAGFSPELRRVVRYGHTGEIGGITGQTVAMLASLGATVLIWTGVALAWRRFQTWASRKQRPSLNAQ